MAFVITRLCRDCVDGACVDVCPCDCILEHRPASGESELPRQLFIDPSECISCNVCAPECPPQRLAFPFPVCGGGVPVSEFLGLIVRQHGIDIVVVLVGLKLFGQVLLECHVRNVRPARAGWFTGTLRR